MIHYKFPPIKSIGAIRNYNMAEQFQLNDYNVIVLTTNNVEVMPTEYLPDHPFVKYSIFTIDYKTIIHRLFRKKISHGLPNAAKSYPLFYRIKNSYPFNLFFDEGGLVYIINAYRRGVKLIRSGNIKVIYSSFRPYADHFVAYYLKKKFPELIWIADFRDPPYDPARRQVVFQGVQRWLGRRIMRTANVNLTVSEGVADFMEQTFLKRPLVLRNSINPEFHRFKSPCIYDKFTITYTGSITLGLQSAEPLFRVLSALLDDGVLTASKIQLIYAGNDSEIWNKWIIKYNLQNISVNLGVQPMREVLSLQKSSDVNLLLTWSGPVIKGILTGKQNEYFAAQRPVLVLVNGTRDEEIEKIYKDLNAGFIFTSASDTLESLKRKFCYWVEEWEKNGHLDLAYNQDKLQEYSWGCQFGVLMDYLKKIS